MTGGAGAGHRVSTERARGLLALGIWVAVLLGALLLFHGLGRGPLGAPPLADPEGLAQWFATRGPAEALMAVLRLLVLALAWYLLGVTTVGVVARLARMVRLVRCADALTVPPVRRLLQGALGLGLATAAVAGVTVPGASPAPQERGEAAVLVAAQDVAGVVVDGPRDDAADEDPDAGSAPGPGSAPGTSSDIGSPPLPGEDPGVLPEAGTGGTFEVESGEHEATGSPGSGNGGKASEDGDERPEAGEVGERPEAGEADESNDGNDREGGDGEPGGQPGTDGGEEGDAVWRVEPGEHLWAIAEAALADAWDSPPSDGDVHAYWQCLLEENRSALPDPGNPDLVYPGVELTLPPLPDAPSR
ncbi:hypothetical protein ER308_11050 [Egibacter rhizosphaerae]|uniref:LysM domain-containing protein n=1 Tax=Egibacter rhizosphaerae TaxID=1670831 RepID=A0A411YFL8_9ACTN|nr:hypothetical protein [Egibacter rhizosphaerae]QBI20043.1 hypothetical protein ER308_11050 [Egibacter rhizosphaerae]